MMNGINFKDLVVAHRGVYNNTDIIENTMDAFNKAIELNLPIELDIRLIKDKKNIVVFHDDNLKRLCNINKKISKLTINEIKNVNLKDTNSTIPLFFDVLNLINGKVLLDVEIKGSLYFISFFRSITKLLDSYDGNFIIKSFNPLYIFLIKLFRKDYIRGILINKTNINIPFIFTLSKPQFICCDSNILYNSKLQKYIKKKKCPVLCYNVKNMDDAKKLLADGFIIDHNINI